MAKRTWIGGTVNQAQVWKGTITTTTTGHTYIVTFTAENGSTYAFSYALVAGDTTVTLAAASWVLAFNANKNNLINGITATSSAGIITLTATVPGTPFYAATSGTGTWSATGNTTASFGANDYNATSNWLEGAVPVANDVVYLTGSTSILYGLNQSAVEVDGFYVTASFTGDIGRAGAYLQIDVEDALRFEYSGTGTAYIDVGTAAISPVVKKTRTASGGLAGLYLKGSALVTIDHQSGVVSLDTATVTTYLAAKGTVVYVTPGCTLTTLHNSGGVVTLEVAITTANNQSGTLTTSGSGAVGTLNLDGGTAILNSSGTVTTCNADGGVLDLTGSRIARTITTLNFRGAKVRYDPAVITIGTAAYLGPQEVAPITLAA